MGKKEEEEKKKKLCPFGFMNEPFFALGVGCTLHSPLPSLLSSFEPAVGKGAIAGVSHFKMKGNNPHKRSIHKLIIFFQAFPMGNPSLITWHRYFPVFLRSDIRSLFFPQVLPTLSYKGSSPSIRFCSSLVKYKTPDCRGPVKSGTPSTHRSQSFTQPE